MRKKYFIRWIFRIGMLVAAFWCCLRRPAVFEALQEGPFSRGFNLLSFLWIVWMIDMLVQLAPSRGVVAMGSQKNFGRHFVPREGPGRQRPAKALRQNDTAEVRLQDACEMQKPHALSREDGEVRLQEILRRDNRGALLIAAVFGGILAAVGGFYYVGILDSRGLFMITAVFYVVDITFVLFWCPFRAWFLKNKCCTTCRIFNWDHAMMFLPLIYIRSFYTWSLAGMSLIVLAAWEWSLKLHPERFFEVSNGALRCENCSDRLCGR